MLETLKALKNAVEDLNDYINELHMTNQALKQQLDEQEGRLVKLETQIEDASAPVGSNI